MPLHSKNIRSKSGWMSLPGTSISRAIRGFMKSRSTGPAISRSAATTASAVTASTIPTATRRTTRQVRLTKLDSFRFLTTMARLGKRAEDNENLPVDTLNVLAFDCPPSPSARPGAASRGLGALGRARRAAGRSFDRRTARCSVRQQPLPDRDGATEPGFYDRSISPEGFREGSRCRSRR